MSREPCHVHAERLDPLQGVGITTTLERLAASILVGEHTFDGLDIGGRLC